LHVPLFLHVMHVLRTYVTSNQGRIQDFVKGGVVSRHESLWRVRGRATPENPENVDCKLAHLDCISGLFNVLKWGLQPPPPSPWIRARLEQGSILVLSGFLGQEDLIERMISDHTSSTKNRFHS